MKIIVKYCFFIIVVLIFFNCKRYDEQQYKKLIIGEWTVVCDPKDRDSLIPSLSLFNGVQRQGFIFYKNGICENKLGYFKRMDKKLLFLGTKTKYKFENDSLKILNLANDVWISKKICILDSDTLICIDNDNILTKYIKVNYKINTELFFDKIIVSSSGCYGICPVNDICIDRQGNVVYFGQYYNAVNGLFKSKINLDEYAEIESNFKKANIENLKNNYSANWTDDETVTVTFIKNNQIIKTISDYGRQAPTEFYWACIPVRYLYQHIDLAAYSTQKKFPLFIYNFEQDKYVYPLEKSEGFFLLLELQNGKCVQHDFITKYAVICKDYDGEIIKLLTDGRYYKYERQKETEVIDIGYNFIERNHLHRQKAHTLPKG